MTKLMNWREMNMLSKVIAITCAVSTALTGKVWSETEIASVEPLRPASVLEEVALAGLGSEIASLTIPDELGSIKGFYPAKTGPGERVKNQPLVIYILEAHTNYEAERSIASILDLLIKKLGLRLVLVEGGVGNTSVSRYRALGTREKRKEVAEQFLKEGKFSAEEYIDLKEDYPLLLWGIENSALYDENLIAFSRAMPEMNQASAVISELESAAGRLKETIYDPEHLEYLKKRDSYEKGGAAFLLKKYVHLAETAEARHISLAGYPSFEGFIQLAGEEGETDFSNIQFDRDQVVRFLTRKVPYREIKYFIDEWPKTQENRERQVEYFDRLSALARKYGAAESKLEKFRSYIKYLTRLESIVSDKLMEEVKALEATVEQSFLTSEDRKQLHGILKNLSLVGKLFQFQMTPEEYKEYQIFRLKFNDAGWRQFLADKAGEKAIEYDWEASLERLKERMVDFELFYSAANLRDQALAENALKKVTMEGESVSALIAGGFHKERMIRKLTGMGLNVLVVAPRFASDTDYGKYYDILKSRWESKTW